MNRRTFLHSSLAAGASTAFASNLSAKAPEAKPKSKRPNVLFIWTDQQTADAMSCAGNTWLKTPAMDALADQGVRFERAYCSDPICVPSRSSWITGRACHECGVTFNADEPQVALKAPPLSPAIQESGYDTGYVGKWHIPHPEADHAWHGFDFVRHARGNKLDPDVLPACNEFLRRDREQPFFLVASFVNPHDICERARLTAGVDKGMPNGELPPPPPAGACPPLPANFAIPEGEPEVIRQLQALAPRTYPTTGYDEGTWRQYLWAYYRLVERVDAQIGAILQTLRDIGADDNTLILFSSDHGDGVAAHHWNQKTLFYEETARVPLIVRPPNSDGRGRVETDALVNMNLDFFPTVYDYLGIEIPAWLEGKSLRPLIENESGAAGHPFVISQNDLAPDWGVSGGVFGRMIRTERYKYIRFSTGTKREQLFDLDNDPGELRDLTLDPAFAPVLKAHQRQLYEWMEARGDPFAKL